MKNLTVLVEYSTNEKINQTEHTYQLRSKKIEVTPLKIFRRPASYQWRNGRYFYGVTFKTPSDSAFPDNSVLFSDIKRKENPKFKPKDFVFVNDVCDLTGVNCD